jgi:hypothetical protein
MHRSLLSVICLVMFSMIATPSVFAVEPIEIVHREQVQVGSYRVEVGFSEWPILADRSLDIVFIPEGGIDPLQGTVTLISPTGDEYEMPLLRHPRQRTAWGLDVIALNESGPWSMLFVIDGPAGQGIGRLAPLTLGNRPGPDLLLSWMVGLLPFFGLIALITLAWLRVRPGKQVATNQWHTSYQ